MGRRPSLIGRTAKGDASRCPFPSPSPPPPLSAIVPRFQFTSMAGNESLERRSSLSLAFVFCFSVLRRRGPAHSIAGLRSMWIEVLVSFCRFFPNGNALLVADWSPAAGSAQPLCNWPDRQFFGRQLEHVSGRRYIRCVVNEIRIEKRPTNEEEDR